MIFEFSVKKTFNQSIDVFDMGNTALRCTNRLQEDYYIIVKTIMGKTHIVKYGPVCPDLDMLLDDFFVNYKKIDYREAAIYKEIDKFINDYKKEIESVEEITEYEAWDNFPGIQQQFENV
jgi:rhamnose utilization protein RhaD (predicted bifunctional aldolase and dehydrogenase)